MGIPKAHLPAEFRNELARIARAGFHLLPLGGGADGKAPLLSAWAGPLLPLARVLAPLYRAGAQVYGIRLDGLAVVDIDTDDPALVAAMEARFGPTPVHTKSPRGRHLWYRFSGTAPNLRAEGLPIDIKAGPRAYVVGPASVRSDGGIYSPAKGVLGVDTLPLMRLSARPTGIASTETVPIGQRHKVLAKEAMRMVEFVDSAEELTANLAALRDNLCEDAATMPDSEVQGIAEWMWRCRLENRVFSGRDSSFRVDRLALDALRKCHNGTDAIELYLLLMDAHGHTPGKRFALDFKAMRQDCLTRLSVPRLREARRTMQSVGLLQLVGKHRAGSVHQTFILCRLRPGMTAPNVTTLANRRGTPGRKTRGEGLRLHMTPEIAPSNLFGGDHYYGPL